MSYVKLHSRNTHNSDGRPGRWVVAVLALLTMAAAVALSLALGSTAGEATTTGAAERADIEAVAPEIPELIAGFRRAQTATDRLPANGNLPADLQPGENPLLARRLGGTGGPATYAWPMKDGVCKVANRGGGCAPTSLLAERGVLLGTSFSSDERAVYVDALAVDGVREVVLTLEDGREITAAIENNAFNIVLPADPVRASWVKPDGSREVQTDLVPRPED